VTPLFQKTILSPWSKLGKTTNRLFY
jgi:hypothetical protein